MNILQSYGNSGDVLCIFIYLNCIKLNLIFPLINLIMCKWDTNTATFF